MSFLDAFNDLFVTTIGEKKEKEDKERREREETEIAKKNRIKELLDLAIKKYEEKILFSVEAKITNANICYSHKTPVVLTENRVLFTSCKDRTANHIFLIDFPYEEIRYVLNSKPYDKIYKVSPTYDIPCGTLIYGKNSNYLLWVNGVSEGELAAKVKKYAGENLGKKYNREKTTSTEYINHCWKCKKGISSTSNKRCPVCKMFICSSCGACFCTRK